MSVYSKFLEKMNLLGLIALFFIVAKADPAGGFIQKGMHTLLGNRQIKNDSNGFFKVRLVSKKWDPLDARPFR